jgi:predicted permease
VSGTDPDAIDREVDDEVDFHLRAQVDDLVRDGWSERDAWKEARRRFGDPDRVRTELVRLERKRERMVTRASLLEGLLQDASYALRQLRRKPLFAFGSVAVLALGVGAAASVFAVADAVLIRTLPFPDAEQLVAVYDEQDEPGYPPSVPEFRDWKREGSFFDALVAVVTNDRILQLGDAPERVVFGYVEGDLAALMGTPAVLGRTFTEAEVASGAQVVMLDEDFWRSRFAADPSVLGTSLTLSGEPATVVGVLPREARLLFERNDVKLWGPLPDLPMFERGLHLLDVVGRISPDVTLEQAEGRTMAMADAIRATEVTRHGVGIVSLRDALLGDTRRAVVTLIGAVVLVLLVVSANLAHLLLARGWARARELAVRGALGAGHGRLLRQLLTESALLGLLGGVGGILLAVWVTRVVASAAGGASVAALASPTNPRVLAFTVLSALAMGLGFGWFPAREAAGRRPGRALREGGGSVGVRGRTRARQTLVAAEIALSTVLLTGAGLLVRTVRHLLHEDIGFTPQGRLTAQIVLPGSKYPEASDRARFWSTLLERVHALPGVESAGLVSQLPLTGDTNGGFEIVGKEFPQEQRPRAKKRFAGPGYFESMEIPVLAGRSFLPSDRMGEPEVAVISRSLAEQYWPGEDPLGRRIRFLWQTSNEQEIIGVVGDVRSDRLDQEGTGTIYLAHDQIGPAAMGLVASAPRGPSLAEPLRRLVAEIDPTQPIHDVQTMDQVVRRSASTRTTLTTLLASFAGLALVLAAVGVYAVAAQSVAGRTREIAVRLAVGGDPSTVLRALLRAELVPVGVGLVVGLTLTGFATRALAGWLYQVSERDPLTLGAVALVLCTASLVALAGPALKAVRVSPTEALRQE